MRWRSVIVPAIMPKPDVVALTGGYRRTPFMQIGADVYCDSALMCRVIDRIAPEPPLYPAESAGVAEIVAQWADSQLFWAAVPYTMQPAGAHAHLRGCAAGLPEGVRRRPRGDGHRRCAALRPTTPVPRCRATCAGSSRCSPTSDVSCSAAKPCIADFSAAQSIWFMRRAPPIAALLADYPPAGRLVLARRRLSATARPTPMGARRGDRARRPHQEPCADGGRSPKLGFAAGDEVTRRRRRLRSRRDRRRHRRPRRRRGRDRPRRCARRPASTCISRASASA